MTKKTPPRGTNPTSKETEQAQRPGKPVAKAAAKQETPKPSAAKTELPAGKQAPAVKSIENETPAKAAPTAVVAKPAQEPTKAAPPVTPSAASPAAGPKPAEDGAKASPVTASAAPPAAGTKPSGERVKTAGAATSSAAPPKESPKPSATPTAAPPDAPRPDVTQPTAAMTPAASAANPPEIPDEPEPVEVPEPPEPAEPPAPAEPSIEPTPVEIPEPPESPVPTETPTTAFAAKAEPAMPAEPLPAAMDLESAPEAEIPHYPEIEPEPPMMEPEPEWIPEAAHEPEPQVHHHVSTVPSMFIVHITPELAPVAKVGGLADVVFGLCNEMEIRGNHVEIILPKYDCLRYDHVWGMTETYKDLWVPWYGGAIHCTVYFGFVHGRKCFFIEPHSHDNFFNRGAVYGFNDDIMRFAFFSRAAIEFLWKSGKNPEIIHCHDWQTALVPVFLFEIYQFLGMRHPRVCYTIHNFKHQGVTGVQILNATGLNRPEYYLHYDRLRDNHHQHAVNLMKGGVVYSNFVTTVSPRHASEAKDHGQGFGLEPTLHIHHNKYGGVVNGIDYNMWNPEIDRYIPHHYGLENIEDKYHNKRALRHRLMLTDNEKPIVAFVGRLDPQKGLELLRHAIFYTLQRRGQFVLLGSSPDGQINNYFWGLKHQLNDNPDCHIEIGFNEELSHLIYAGADIVLVPSRFEPCGLTQLIAMRYGTVPVVREVGGLADTVFDKDYSNRPLHERNGYIFRDYDNAGLESALGRALSCYYDYPEHFRELIRNCIRYDYSWKNPGQDYLNIYDYIREK